jgi:2-oxoisovalerate dehydrogenase E1 component
VDHVCEEASIKPKLKTTKSVMKTITANMRENILPSIPKMNNRKNIFGKEFQRLDRPQHMAKLINYALTDILNQYSNT